MSVWLSQSVRESLSVRRVVVTLGVATPIGLCEWLGTGHPLGLAFAIGMGLLVVVAAPLPWLLLLPWGLRPSLSSTLLRMLGVVAVSTVAVGAGFAGYFLLLHWLVPTPVPLLRGASPLLDVWPSVAVSIPLFAGAGWGLARHLELERRLEIHDVREVALHSALEEARMVAWRSKLDPHFLFNALNLIAELCRDDPPEAERSVLRLCSLLRAALDHGREGLVPLERELGLCRDYLELCRSRFGDRLEVQIESDPQTDRVPVPAMALQTLCENGVRHGIERQPQGGTIRLSSEVREGSCLVHVDSPGPFRGDGPAGLGLELTRRRLALAFGPGASLAVGTVPAGNATRATLTIPRGAA